MSLQLSPNNFFQFGSEILSTDIELVFDKTDPQLGNFGNLNLLVTSSDVVRLSLKFIALHFRSLPAKVAF